ncbi:contact-dependent growth inhibition system immunity protein [Nocardia sp. GAS34]|uniref:contact-dependent growth inhibition system immunity protein n=1 Tax=unclassified Nocardia TaxID=2637762 RepID=UPI003D2196BF
MVDVDSQPRTLEAIEGSVWADPPPDATRLMVTVHELRRKPLESLTAEDLRILLGQDVGTATLMPYALNLLEKDPLAHGDYYPGDLLVTVLRLPDDYWSENRDVTNRLIRLTAGLASVTDIVQRFPVGHDIWRHIDRLHMV